MMAAGSPWPLPGHLRHRAGQGDFRRVRRRRQEPGVSPISSSSFLILGLAFIESLALYTLVIIFVKM